jgi:hypothetical protein
MTRQKEERWRQIIRAWKRSGMTQKDFCGAEHIAFSTFQYWRKRVSNPRENPRFVPLVPPEKVRREISVSFETGIRMIIPATIARDVIGRLIYTVDEALCGSTGIR